jgi:InsA C-terminal domain
VDCERRIFLGRYHLTGRLPEVKRPVVDMALNGSGIRDTARVPGVSPTTVISTLKKAQALQPVNPAVVTASEGSLSKYSYVQSQEMNCPLQKGHCSISQPRWCNRPSVAPQS